MIAILGLPTQPAQEFLSREADNERGGHEDSSALTEPFQRGAGRIRLAGQEQHAGTGLGLAIADRITRAHDGALSISSRAGGGLRARIELPHSADAAQVPSAVDSHLHR